MAELTIDGTSLAQMSWVHASNGIATSTLNGERILRIRSADDTLAALADWASRDGHDTTRVNPVFANTKHGALNNHVQAHTVGDWNDQTHVLVAPLSGMIAANGAPAVLNPIDTYWQLPRNGALVLPQSILITPDTDAILSNDSVRSRSGDTIRYATTFNAQREHHLVAGLSRFGTESLHADVVDRLGAGVDVAAVRASLEQPRSLRPPEVNAALDKELSYFSKVAATHEAIEQHGPVRRMEQWSWRMKSGHDGDTRALADSIGSLTGLHSNTSNHEAIVALERGRAPEISLRADLDPQTRALARDLSTDPRYLAFARAKAVDAELAGIVGGEIGRSEISADGAQRLAVMARLNREGNPLPQVMGESSYRMPSNVPVGPGHEIFDTMLGFAARKYPDNVMLSEEHALAQRSRSPRLDTPASIVTAALNVLRQDGKQAAAYVVPETDITWRISRNEDSLLRKQDVPPPLHNEQRPSAEIDYPKSKRSPGPGF